MAVRRTRPMDVPPSCWVICLRYANEAGVIRSMAARQALADADLQMSQIALVGSHNPFAVNDAWFSQQMDFPLERMNVKGCSLIYVHPQGPTGMRGIIELVWSLREAGGGLGLFTGCAAGDTGAAIVIRVD
jgi:acetyl-CoA acetyltransferase